MFSGAQHLNWMDKIASHVIQMDSNSQSLNSTVSDTRASDSKVSDSMVSKASDMKGLGGLRHESQTSRIQVLGLGFEKGSWRLEG
jgi:hypothetical protein